MINNNCSAFGPFFWREELKKILAMFLLLLSFSVRSEVKQLSSVARVFNTECPAPKLCEKMYDDLQSCEKGLNQECDNFVDNFRKLLQKYDCKRSFDTLPVFAIWLCDSHEGFLDALAKMKTPKALELYGSQELRNTLDGHLGQEHRARSKSVEKK